MVLSLRRTQGKKGKRKMNLEQLKNKFNVNESELILFNKLKNNYFISDNLFIKNNKTYSIKIEYNENSLAHLFNNAIKEDDLIYTLKESNKIISKGTKKQAIKALEKII